MGSYSQQPVADSSQHGAEPCGEFSVYAHRQRARLHCRACARYLPDLARRPWSERLDFLGADHGVDAFRSALGDYFGDWDAQGTAARWRERASDAYVARDRPGRSGRPVYPWRYERQEEDHGLWT